MSVKYTSVDNNRSSVLDDNFKTEFIQTGDEDPEHHVTRKRFVIFVTAGTALTVFVLISLGLFVFKKLFLKVRSPPVPHRAEDDVEENSSMLVTDNIPNPSSSSVRSIWSSLREGCSFKGKRDRKLREIKTRPNCYVSSGGKVLCNETMQTENAPFVELGCLLGAILDKDTKQQLQELFVPMEDLTLLNVIGHGGFGTVWLGLHNHHGNHASGIQQVAVKTVKDSCSNDDVKFIINEALVMSDFKHPHIMSLVGVAVDANVGLPLLIMPYMENGDLQLYLRKFRYEEEHKNSTPDVKQLCVFCLHVARGMEYLEVNKYIHRDLAGRNCMLDGALRVRIADFGLMKDVYSQSHYQVERGTRLPVRWMAPESLKDRYFTITSDVWSYGVLLWEIFTLGQIPYPFLENCQVLEYLMSGKRMDVPDTCPSIIGNLMKECWDIEASKRPSFKKIAKMLDSFLEKEMDYLYFDAVETDVGDNVGNSVLTRSEVEGDMESGEELKRDVNICTDIDTNSP